MQIHKSSTNILSAKSNSTNTRSTKIDEDDKSIEKESVYVQDEQGADNSGKKSTFKYVLVGEVIKVFLMVGGVQKELIKTIPVLQASPEVLAQCENITLFDIISILQEQEEEKHKNSNESKGSESAKNIPKEISEYMKHESEESSTTLT